MEGCADPAAHADPGPQEMQPSMDSSWLTVEYVPDGQLWADGLPSGQYVPGSQRILAVLAPGQRKPARSDRLLVTRIMVVWGICDMRGGPFDLFASASPIPAGHGPWHCGPAWCSGSLPPMMPAEQGKGNSASTVLEGRINGLLICAPPTTSSQWPGGAGCRNGK